jgi:toxin ParE1/3/4
MKVRFSRQASADLHEILRTIALDNPTAARRFGRRLRERALSLSTHPQRGGPLEGHETARRLVVGPYLIVYRVGRELVQILQIVHGARDLDALLGADPRNDER